MPTSTSGPTGFGKFLAWLRGDLPQAEAATEPQAEPIPEPEPASWRPMWESEASTTHAPSHLAAQAVHPEAALTAEEEAPALHEAIVAPPSRESASDTLRESAFDALHRRDWDAAIPAWDAYRLHLPDEAEGYTYGTLALREAGRLDEADALAGGAVERFPDQPRLFIERGLISFITRDWTEARSRFAEIRARFPDEVEGYTRGSEIAQNRGDEKEALALLEEAITRRPDDAALRASHAELAERLDANDANDANLSPHPADRALRDAAFAALGRRDWPEAIAAFEQLRSTSPDDPDGVIFGITALCEAGRPEDAEAVAQAGLERFGEHRWILKEWATICVYTRDWPEAERRFARLRAAAPDEREGYVRGAEIAEILGDWSQALTILEQGCTFRPDDRDLLRQAAHLAEKFHFWDRAVVLWRHLRDLDAPADAFEGEARSLLHAGRLDEIADTRADRRTASGAAGSQRTTAEIAARFESLGGGSNRNDLWGYGCEFGYFQRSLTLEPLDFLRWASIPPAGLLAGLTDDFAAAADPDEMTFLENDDPIWNLSIARYGIRIDHTGVFKKDFTADQARRRIATHMGFLRDKFLEDLAEGQKIFVYRTFDHVMPEAQLEMLAAAIAERGPAQLLYVRLAADNRPAFTVERLGTNLLVGHIDAFAPQPGERLVANHDGWARICAGALALVEG